jgi:hypothetical protein
LVMTLVNLIESTEKIYRFPKANSVVVTRFAHVAYGRSNYRLLLR